MQGTTIVMVFGLPPAGAHVDDPVRGVLAAMSARSRLKEVRARWPLWKGIRINIVGVETCLCECG